MTADTLKSHTRKELASMARRRRVGGWHGMKKQELIDALLAVEKRNRNGARGKRNGSGRTNGKGRNGSRDVPRFGAGSVTRDRLIVETMDARWLYVKWELTQRIVDRARTALGTEWHQAVPVIRIFDVTDDEDAVSAKQWVGDVEVHGRFDDWYVPVENSSRVYELEIGYRTPNDTFFSLAKSKRVKTHRPGSHGRIGSSNDTNGRKPANGKARKGTAQHSQPMAFDAESLPRRSASLTRHQQQEASVDFPFLMDAELIVHGTTHPDAQLTLSGEPVELSKDGRFSLRLSLPDGRQVIPAITITPSGEEKRTIVLAIERNTKRLDTQILDELQF
jgi:hypothetical protein